MNMILFSLGLIIFTYCGFMAMQNPINRSFFYQRFGLISFIIAIILIILSFVL